MSAENSFDNKRTIKDPTDEPRERLPTATLHYGGPAHDFMYRPSLPLLPPAGPLTPERPALMGQSPPGLRMNIYTCERCMHGFTHASDFLHHKAICMGTLNTSNPEEESRLRKSVEAEMEKIIDKDTPKNNLTSNSLNINFEHIAKSVNVPKTVSDMPRPQVSPGSSKSPKSGPKFSCRYCDKAFDAMYIQSHELTHLFDSPEKPYSCEFCGRAFANLPACQNHERIHTEPRPYICDLCQKGFMTAGILKTHMLTHTGLKRFRCPTCEKAFTTAGNLKTHENIHKGEKPFACRQCGKCFTTAGNLKTHEKIHIGLKPFQCDICMKSFTTAGNLKTHENIHTGNKPFECDQCHKSFTTAGNLKTHYRLHTGERPYVCQICSQAYHSSANLRSHQKAQHGIEPMSDQGSHKLLFSPHDMSSNKSVTSSPGVNVSSGLLFSSGNSKIGGEPLPSNEIASPDLRLPILPNKTSLGHFSPPVSSSTSHSSPRALPPMSSPCQSPSPFARHFSSQQTQPMSSKSQALTSDSSSSNIDKIKNDPISSPPPSSVQNMQHHSLYSTARDTVNHHDHQHHNLHHHISHHHHLQQLHHNFSHFNPTSSPPPPHQNLNMLRTHTPHASDKNRSSHSPIYKDSNTKSYETTNAAQQQQQPNPPDLKPPASLASPQATYQLAGQPSLPYHRPPQSLDPSHSFDHAETNPDFFNL